MKYDKVRAEDIWGAGRLREGVFLLDVRTPAEFEDAHIPGAVNVPLDEVAARVEEVRSHAAEAVTITCHTAFRSKIAHHELDQLGVPNLRVLSGGIVAWQERGLPVARIANGVSIQRQVQLFAGSLVLLGVLLGALVSPWLLALAGLVGAGLVLAGATDTCAMAALLARMPWNRKAAR